MVAYSVNLIGGVTGVDKSQKYCFLTAVPSQISRVMLYILLVFIYSFIYFFFHGVAMCRCVFVFVRVCGRVGLAGIIFCF